MKKTMRFLSMAALALVGAVMTGCSSDDNIIDTPQQPENKSNIVTLTTTVGFDGGAQTRALTSGGVKTFAVDDQIAVVYTKKTGGTTAVAVSEKLTSANITGGTSATFTVTLDDPDKDQNVTYIYPAAMANADGTVNYDALATQNGTLATLESSLDLATYSAAWNGTSLPTGTLANQLAVCAFTLKDNATPTANTITGGLTKVTVTDGTNRYTVAPTSSTFGTEIIYVAIRPVTAALDFIATNGINYYTKTATSRAYSAGTFYNLGLKMAQVPTGALVGKFSVSGSKKVYFSKGNLQVKTTDLGSTWTWAFAMNQWDYIGNAAANTSINGNGTVSANGTVDLFGWVGASSTWTGAAQYGISNSKTNNSTDTYGNVADETLKSDWGNTIGSGWRTLTSAEWTYLFNTRTVNGDTGEGKSYTRGQSVNGKSGVIIYPDDYTGAEYTGSDWATFEAAGCVFRPAAGRRSGSTVSNAGTDGRYWSSSPSGTKNAYYVNFDSSLLNPASNSLYRYYGFSVRLVRDVE